MFNPISQLSAKCLVAPFAASLVLGSFGALDASAQVIIIRDRAPFQVLPPSTQGSYADKSPIINNTPALSPIIQSYPRSSDSYYPAAGRTRRNVGIDRQPYPSGTNIIVNPTIIVPGGYSSRYPYPYPQGSSIYYGSPSGFQIQIGY